MSEEIKTKVCQIVGDRLSRDWRAIKGDENLVTDFGADSLDLAEIAMDLEDCFSLRYYTFEDSIPRTVNGIVQAVAAEKKKQ